MIHLVCDCGYDWDYSGKMKVKVNCPDCRGIVLITKERLETN